MSINARHVMDYVIKETLVKMDAYSMSAERLLMGTAAVESDMGSHLRQIGGPALGIFQMEIATLNDIWENYLEYRPTVKERVLKAAEIWIRPSKICLIQNLAYATAMARVHYMRVREPLPDHKDIHAMADYWKKYYNTEEGKGTTADFVKKYKKYVLPVYESPRF